MAQQGLHTDQEKLCSAFPCGHGDSVSGNKSHREEEDRKKTRGSMPRAEDNNMQAGSGKSGRQAAPGPADEACKPPGSPSETLPTDPEKDSEKEPTVRAAFLKYSCDITLDPNTANARLLLSEGNRKATNMEEDQVYPSHPDRFMDGHLVLGKESLTGRHYWEVERSGGAVSVAVAYKDISRTGTESNFGSNDKSWALDCFDSRYVVRHVYIQAAKPHPVSSKVGVYLDHRAGVLSFYSVSDTMTLLHRVQTTFSRPLHAGLWVHGYKSAAVFCHEASS